MKLGKKLRAVTAGLLTAAFSVGMGAFPGTALETGAGELAGLQAFLLGNSGTGGADYNGDGVVDGMDLTLLQAENRSARRDTGRLYRLYPRRRKAAGG